MNLLGFVGGPCAFINMMASNHGIKLSTCRSTLDRWTLGNKHQGLKTLQTRLNAWSKSFIGNRRRGFYSDKYSIILIEQSIIAIKTIMD